MLKLVEYIKTHPTWEKLLTEKPYCLSIKRNGNLIMFTYNKKDSVFSNPIVRECCGIILEDETFNAVCVPFFKFFEYDEKLSPGIDWNSSSVQKKIDGTQINMWYYNGKWNSSTLNEIYSKDDPLPYDDVEVNWNDLSDGFENASIAYYENYEDLFLSASSESKLNKERLSKKNTYIFEVTSPLNIVVANHSFIRMTHIATRNNITLEETDADIGVNKPKEYYIYCLQDCIEMANKLPYSEEGFVVVDKNYNRIIVKSPAYASARDLIESETVSKEKIVDMIRNSQDVEFLVNYPEFKKAFYEINKRIEKFVLVMNDHIDYILDDITLSCGSRKVFADYAMTTICPMLLFNWNDQKCKGAKEWLWNQTNEKVVDWIGKVEV